MTRPLAPPDAPFCRGAACAPRVRASRPGAGARLATAVLLAGLAGPALALPIIRCGNTYTDTPCPGGQTLEVADTRTPDQVKEHQAITERTQRAADKLEAQRHAREAEEQVARLRAQQEARRQIEFEARMRRLEQPPVVGVRQLRVAGLAPGTQALPPLQRVPMYRVPRPVKPLAGPATGPSVGPNTAPNAGAMPGRTAGPVPDDRRRFQD